MSALTDFYCNSCSTYASADRKSKKYTCCTGCEKRADDAIASRAMKELESTVQVNAIPISKRLRIADIMAGRELKALTSDAWMNCD